MDYTPDASLYATTSSLDDLEHEITRFLDDMSHLDPQETGMTGSGTDHLKRAYTPTPQWAQDAFPSYFDRSSQPAGLRGDMPSTPSKTLPPTYCVSPSLDTAVDSEAYSPHSDISFVTSSTTWSSPSEEHFEEVSKHPDGAQEVYHRVEQPTHQAPEPRRVDDQESLAYVRTMQPDPLAMPGYPAVASSVLDIGKGELQHDGWRAAAPYDSLLPRHVGVDADPSAITSTFPFRPGPDSDVAASPESQGERGAGREASSPSDSPGLNKGKLYACEYEDCSFGELVSSSSIARVDAVLCTDTDRLNNLTQHVKDVHLGLRPHGCPECETRFKRKSDLKRHHISYHTDMGSPRRKDAEGKTATARRKAN